MKKGREIGGDREIKDCFELFRIILNYDGDDAGWKNEIIKFTEFIYLPGTSAVPEPRIRI